MDLVLSSSRGGRRRRVAGGGFSLVEVLLGLVILLVALIGLMPLFARSIQQNIEGKQSSEATGHGRTELENLMQVDFNSYLVTIPNTQNELSQELYYSQGDPAILGDEWWTPTEPPSEVAPWRLTSVVRQFQIGGIRDADLDGIMEVIEGIEDANLDGLPDNPLPGGTDEAFVHLKTLDVTLENRATVVTTGGPTRFELRTFKAF